MPEVRLIDANALIDKRCSTCILRKACADRYEKDGKKYICGDIKNIVNAPTIEAEPVRLSRWAKAGDKQYCIKCHVVTKTRNAPFCWHCGAKMDLRTPTEAALDMADSVMMGGAENG